MLTKLKNNWILILFISTLAHYPSDLLYGQYENINTSELSPDIKTIAIFPFKLLVGSVGGKLDTTRELGNQAKGRKCYSVQKDFYKWVLNNKNKMLVDFQDVILTDSLLNKTKLSYDELFQLDGGALCKYLNVDAVAFSEIRFSNPNIHLNDEILNGMVVGAVDLSTGLNLLNKTSKNTVTCRMSIYDSSGALVWRYSKLEKDFIANNDDAALRRIFVYMLQYKFPFMKN